MQKARVDRLLTAYCAKRVPAAVRSKVRVGYRLNGNALILYEERPGFRATHDWEEMVVGKFRDLGTRGEWRLYWQHPHLRWHTFQARPASFSFAKLLAEVGADPTGIFWG